MEAIAIKSEPQEFEYIKQQLVIEDINSEADSAPAQSMVNHLKSRCGEIFVTKNARNWSFTCTYCDKTTRDIGEFICHIQFKHLNGQYTDKDDDNGDNASDESPSREAAYTDSYLNDDEQHILLQTQNQNNEASQTTIEQVLSLAHNNPPALETIYGCSTSANSGEELIDSNDATGQPNSNKRKRRLVTTPATPEQLHYFVNFCTLHPELYSHDAEDHAKLIELWEELAKDLNAIRGPSRSTSKWISYLNHWKIGQPYRLGLEKPRLEELHGTDSLTGNNSFGQVVFNVTSLNSPNQILLDQQEEYEENIIYDLDSNSSSTNPDENSFSVESLNLDIKEEKNEKSTADDGLVSNSLLCIMDETNNDDPTANENYVQQHPTLKIPNLKVTNTKKTKTSPIKCQYCTKSYKTKQALSNHIKTHTKNQEYQCTICSLCHSTENQFITHVLTHESATCFPCMVCGQDLKSNEERDKHLVSHIEERPYGCDFCKRRFRQNNFLTNHLRIHCQYRCDFCSDDFRSMLSHRRPFACPQCEIKPDVILKVERQRAVMVKFKTTAE